MCVGSPSLLQGGDFWVERDRRHLWHPASWDSPLLSGATGCLGACQLDLGLRS